MKKWPAHWTPRYLADRSREWWFQQNNPDAPWLGPKAVALLKTLLQPQMQGIECGAGRSTPWVAQRVAALESWEEHPAWLQKVAQTLQEKGIRNVRLLAVEKAAEDHWDYAARLAATAFPEPDFALIDCEHHRDALALHFAETLRPGGFLMLDNANWFVPSASRSPHSRSVAQGPANAVWQQFLHRVGDWQCLWTSSGVTDTAFFIRPPRT